MTRHREQPKAEIEEVERPVGRATYGKADVWALEAVMNTLRTGKAIRVPLDGVEPRKMRERYAQHLWRKGMGLRSQRDGEFLIMWVVELPRP